MLIEKSTVNGRLSTVMSNCGQSSVDYGLKGMAFPERLVFAPFVVVVGGRYFFPVPECLLSGSGIMQS
jgi:hypothetical protein